MGEYSFGYAKTPATERQHGFQYSKKQNQEYQFTYDRDIKSDTAKFNSLVPVIKDGTRLFCFDDFTDLSKISDAEVFNQSVIIDKKEIKSKFNISDFMVERLYENKGWFEYDKFLQKDVINNTNHKQRFILMSTRSKGIFERGDLFVGKHNYEISILKYTAFRRPILASKYRVVSLSMDIKRASHWGNTAVKKMYKPNISEYTHADGAKRTVYEAFRTKEDSVHRKVRDMMMSKELFVKGDLQHKIWIDENDLVKRENYKIHYTNNLFGERHKRAGFFIKNNDLGYRPQRRIDWIHEERSVYRPQRNMYQNKLNKLLKRNQILIFQEDSWSGGYKSNMDIFLNDSGKSLQSESKGVWTKSNLFTEGKNKPVFIDSFKMKWSFKNNYDVDLINESYSFKRLVYDIFQEKQKAGTKNKIIMNNTNYGSFSEKDNVGIITNLDNYLIKNPIPLSSLISIATDEHSDGFLLPIIKDESIGNLYDDRKSFSQGQQKISIGEEYFSSKMSKSYLSNIDISASKKQSSSFIQYKNELLKKGGINGKLWIEVFGEKDGKSLKTIDTRKQAGKKQKQSFVSEQYHWVSKSELRTKTIKNTWLTKDAKITWSNVDLCLEKIGHGISLSDSEIQFKKKAHALFSKEQEWVNTRSKELDSQEKDSFVIKLNNELYNFRNLTNTFVEKETISTDITNSLIAIPKIIRESKIINEVMNYDKAVKELDYKQNNDVQWAWVYETPDPFENQWIGVDELLLPENDTRYEDFEDIVFDKKTLRPKNPVQKIDETTWVAKYPTKHPLPDYSKIGIEYVDVETGLMHHIFLEFYRIWQKNIFKFGGMSMTKSVELMLEYLYSWIILYIPDKYQNQALRTLRLIRWFGETSIIQNSQYIISYEVEDLKSNLHTGECDIQYTSKNMIISQTDAVFVTDKENEESFVEFYSRNAKETTISFSIISTVGTVFVYINDELADIVTGTSQNLTYKLDYADPINKIKIIKPQEHNRNRNFCIGYVTIKDAGAGELKIEYDPKLKAGNKPLDEIAKKMIAYANLYEDSDGVLEELRKGNLGVSEVYKRLQHYWDIHHNNQIKGKRLTIKEV